VALGVPCPSTPSAARIVKIGKQEAAQQGEIFYYRGISNIETDAI